MAPSTLPDVPEGLYFHPTDRQIIGLFLGPMAVHGADRTRYKGDIVRGVDVVSTSTSPDALPFERRHVRRPDEVLAHFFGDQPTGSRGHEVPGGAWLPCGVGGDKAYSGGDGEETVAYRRKYEFRPDEADHHGEEVTPAQPRWRMKEYRLNKGAAAFRRVHAQPNPNANLDCVLRVVYTKAVPPPRPSPVFEDGRSYEDQPAAAEAEAAQ